MTLYQEEDFVENILKRLNFPVIFDLPWLVIFFGSLWTFLPALKSDVIYVHLLKWDSHKYQDSNQGICHLVILKSFLLSSQLDYYVTSDSCNLDGALNEIGVEFQIFVIFTFFNSSRVLQFGAQVLYGCISSKDIISSNLRYFQTCFSCRLKKSKHSTLNLSLNALSK